MLGRFFEKHDCMHTEFKYKFELYGQDTVSAISRDRGAEIFLDRDARTWANKLTEHQELLISLNKQVKGLQSVTKAYIKVIYCVHSCLFVVLVSRQH